MNAPLPQRPVSSPAAAAWTPEIAAAVAALAADPQHPTGLPAPFYTDEAMLALERETVLARGWTALAFGADVPRPGDLSSRSIWRACRCCWCAAGIGNCASFTMSAAIAA